MKKLLTVICLCIATTAFATMAFAQKAERKNVRTGNKLYEKEKYTESEISYRKSIDVNPRSVEGIYNLGDALYKQEKFPESAEQYQLVAGQTERLLNEDPENAARVSQVFHNMGNVGMKAKEYQKSIEAYKQSLRLNPADDETRYNLALAQKLLQQQQQDQQDQNQDQDQDKKDEEKDQDQEQKQDKQQDKQDQQKDQEQKEQKTQEQQQQNEQISRDNAQQILDAFLQDEKDTQEKVKKVQMQQQQSRKKDKQW